MTHHRTVRCLKKGSGFFISRSPRGPVLVRAIAACCFLIFLLSMNGPTEAQPPGLSGGAENDNALIESGVRVRPREIYGEPIFSCNFDDTVDANRDRWPDGWSRRRGYGYPDYLEIQIN